MKSKISRYLDIPGINITNIFFNHKTKSYKISEVEQKRGENVQPIISGIPLDLLFKHFNFADKGMTKMHSQTRS